LIFIPDVGCDLFIYLMHFTTKTRYPILEGGPPGGLECVAACWSEWQGKV